MPAVKKTVGRRTGECPDCFRLYRLSAEGIIHTHVAKNKAEECSGSGKKPIAISEYRKLYRTAYQIDAEFGVPEHMVKRWAKVGYVEAAAPTVGGAASVFDAREIEIMITMRRLMEAGFSRMSVIEPIARARQERIDIMRAMGYDGDSFTTEHTLESGMLLTID